MQDLAMNIANAPAANPFASLAGGAKSADHDAAQPAEKFTQLLHRFADASAKLTADNKSLLLPNAETALPTGIDLAAILAELKIDPETLAATDIKGDATEISPELMAQLAALMQANPQLQTILKGDTDLKVVAEAIDYLQTSGSPDLSQFNLPADVKDELLKLAAEPQQLAQLGDAVENILQQPDLLKAVKFAAAATQQNNSDKDTTTEALKADQTVAANANIAKGAPEKPAPRNEQQFAQGQERAAEVINPIAQANSKTSMSDIQISTTQEIARPDAALAAHSEQMVPSFDQTLAHAFNAADTLQHNKQSIMSAAGIEAYSARATAPGGEAAQAATMQVAVQLQRNAQAARNNQFIIQLQPEELGRIEVTMKFEGNRIRAVIAAEKEETMNLLKGDSKALDRALQNAGVQTDAGSLEFSLGQNFQNFDQAKKNSHRDPAFGMAIANTELQMNTKQDLSAAHIMMMAEGRVDVKL